MTLTSLFVAIGIAASPTPPDSLISADSAMSLLRHGGFTIMWRHAQTDRSVSDIPGQATERYQQRNLNDVGVALSKSVGAIFKARGIPVADVMSSPMYRTTETAQYAFGRVTKTPLLQTMDPSAEERALVLAQPASGANRVLVTHHFIIERNAPGIKPGDINEGEAAIVKSDGKSLKTIAIIKVADWTRMAADPATQQSAAVDHPAPSFALAGVTAEKAKMIHSARGMVAISYVQSFNGRDAMKAFLETHVVPNPARPIAQRLETYDKLRLDLGALATITSFDFVSDEELVVTASTTSGKPVKITFTQEKQAPFRAIAINLAYGPHGGAR